MNACVEAYRIDLSPGMKYEHVVTPSPLEIGTGRAVPAPVARIRSQAVPSTVAWYVSRSPANDQ
jgi:hypothetical protein